MLSHVSQEDIDAHRQQRERLTPIARSVGLVYDEQNFLLLKALDTIAREQERARASTAPHSAGGFLMPDPTVPGSQIAAARAANASLGPAPQQQTRQEQPDMGDRVCDVLRAMGELAPLRTNENR